MKTRARDKQCAPGEKETVAGERGRNEIVREREVEADRKMERFLGRDGEEGEEKKTNQWKISTGVRCFG